MTDKKRSPSSTRWLKEHFDDRYVKKAHQQGLRSRAVFKLDEIQDKDHLLKTGMVVVDLGAAPGGWSQLAVDKVGPTGRVIACDLLAIDPIAGVDFLQGDFRDDGVLHALLTKIAPHKVNVILSDMAPNMTGTQQVDQARAMYLVELALDMCHQVLGTGGSFVVKVFQGEGFEAYLADIKRHFQAVKIRKPDSSRARSREVYIVATGYKANPVAP